MSVRNPFIHEVTKSLPRILSAIDSDETNLSYGIADRYYWAWGLTDFGNATLQGCANGLSRLWVSGLWPFNSSEDVFLKRIYSLFYGTQFLTRKDGSLEEAFPNEGSYCVTALVAFDLLVTLDVLSEKISYSQKNTLLKILNPIVNFLIKNDENHAIISNHLATSVAALVRWHKITNDTSALRKAKTLVNRISHHQSVEGWFKEYEGADPGYLTLCLHYLTDAHFQQEKLGLFDPIAKSIKFLEYFVHPDGSFGGLYGSRCTKFYYPSGILSMAPFVPEAASLSSFMLTSINEQKVVGLSSMDTPNLIPMFNSYVWAALLSRNDSKVLLNTEPLPCKRKYSFSKDFPEAGLFVDRSQNYYSIINYKKGGVTYHFTNDKLNRIDGGVLVRSPNGLLGSSQFYDHEQQVSIKDDRILIRHRISLMPKRLTTPFKFLILRTLCFSFFRFYNFRESVKKFLVKYLISKPKLWPIWNEREIILGEDLEIVDCCKLKKRYQKISLNEDFVSIHMASQGYWQIQDENL